MKPVLTYRWLALLLLLCCIAGCGGGSKGTGGETLTGKILDQSGAPANAVTVTVVATGDSDVTDGAGEYSIDTDLQNSTSVQYRLQRDTLDVSVVVDEVPADTRRLSVDFSVSFVDNTANATRVEVEERQNNAGGNNGGDGGQGGSGNGNGNHGDSNGSGNGSDGGDHGSGNDQNVQICHNPDGSNPQTITVDESAAQSHLAHGDSRGACSGADDNGKPDKPDKPDKPEKPARKD